MNQLSGEKRPTDPAQFRTLPGFASQSDFGECKRLHRRFGTTYFFATRRLPTTYQRRVNALYGFVRVPDEWVDNPRTQDLTERRRQIRNYRNEFLRGMDGVSPNHPVLRAFCDVAHEVSLPLEEPLRFLDAMEQDIDTSRYETYDELRHYMRGSATAVGLMMCRLLESRMDHSVETAATALGEAMQLTNFLRDIGEDYRRGRIYMPIEDLNRFPGSYQAIVNQEVTTAFMQLMKFQIDRARHLYAESDPGILLLPRAVQPGVKLARILYSKILNKIEEQHYDVFTRRARTSKLEKVSTALRVLSGSS